jgi:hypothetical protein
MELYYRYLDAVEEAKRLAQPWQCEVTLFPQGEDAVVPALAAATKPGFVCDEPE